ncbi:DUF1850 domain-containing protein [Mesobacillus foraminis]|uniref:RocC n=1 Tax=Mesobacillus foraminis TaxID=279826 RepID=A0A4R2BKN8_9BACI|nr:DUF1850 domain-containing protein [Mesobacillus foraminis]TCN27797.1 hypothetical protein EV146_101125 [Mesobacillus foraminis]
MANKRKKVCISLLLIVFIAIISMFIPYKQSLVFLQTEQNEVLCYLPVAPGDRFKIKYLHSIHLSDVIESYEVTKQQGIRQYELEYEDFAIGMPSEAAEGESFVNENGKYYIKNMRRDFPYFDLRVGKVRANHTLIYKNTSFPLAHAIEPGTRVRVQVRKINMIQELRGVNILDAK